MSPARCEVPKLALLVAILVACRGPSSTSDDAATPDAPPSVDAPVDAPAFVVVKNGSTYVATSTADRALAVEVDCDDEALDGRYFGIVPVLAGKRLEIAMYGGPRFPFFTPDFDAGAIRCASVVSDASRLLVRLEAGSYRMLDPNAADEPVPLEAELSVQGGHLVARASGLFYMMPTAANTTLQITSSTVTTRTITAATPAFTDYQDGVTSLLITDSIFGEISIATNIARLQVQLYNDGSQGFELDLDHTFTDLGQTSVSATVVLP